MATAAGVANMGGVDRGSGVARLDNVMLAVAIGTQRRLCDSARQGLPVHAGLVWSATSLWHMPQVSGTAVRNAWDLGSSNLVRAAVAQGAIRGALVAALALLAVDAEGVIAGLVRMASGAFGLGDAGRVGSGVVTAVAGVAGESGVSALGEFLPLVVASRAIDYGRPGIGR